MKCSDPNCNCSAPENNCGCPWTGHLDDCPFEPKFVDVRPLPKWMQWLGKLVPPFGQGIALGQHIKMERLKKNRDRALARANRELQKN